ncbi:hypothetical protein MKW94_013502 [Papaver nudicaule]|uniref:Uncharacterized protein n=1 Tax=Papaver nudicaule TaxID=74823 RepID=A0AA41SF03_PAPNU|nr:hypothetical protein [Papaver nudicaule]
MAGVAEPQNRQGGGRPHHLQARGPPPPPPRPLIDREKVGITHSHGMGNVRRQDDQKALADLSFQIGDYLDVAIL